jgi:cyanophycinase
MSVLMAIGGNMQLNGPIAWDFYQRCGGADARLVIIPAASSRINGGSEYLQAFKDLGLHEPPVLLPVRERLDSFNNGNLLPIQQASGIFFTGGNQLRLMTVLAGTPMMDCLFEAFQRGTIVAGTSAGAAVMGRVMISSGKTGSGARSGTAQFAEGLGFADNVLFDQHFYQRNRIGRLVYAITIHPQLLGIGIDEDTAALIEDERLTVIGKRVVTIIDGADIMESNIDQVSNGAWFGVSSLRLHQLTAGCEFNLKTRKALIKRNPLQNDRDNK